MNKLTSYLSALVLGVALLWATPAQSQVSLPFTETFEDSAAVSNNWNVTSCPGWLANPNFVLGNPSVGDRGINPGVSTDEAHSGTHSIHYHYGGHQQEHINLGARAIYGLAEWPLYFGCAHTLTFTPSRVIWFTWWEKIKAGFQVDEIGTKGLQQGWTSDQGTDYSWFLYPFFLQTLDLEPYSTTPTGGLDVIRHLGTISTPFETWTCFEWNGIANDNGVANGVWELFVNGNSSVRATGIQLGNPNTGIYATNYGFSFTSTYLQDGMGEIYRDDITISTTRTNMCSGVSDITAPSTPSSLTATVISALAFLMILGGFYGRMATDRVLINRLPLRTYSIDSKMLRTVAIVRDTPKTLESRQKNNFTLLVDYSKNSPKV